jgi:hypothetical protein
MRAAIVEIGDSPETSSKLVRILHFGSATPDFPFFLPRQITLSSPYIHKQRHGYPTSGAAVCLLNPDFRDQNGSGTAPFDGEGVALDVSGGLFICTEI